MARSFNGSTDKIVGASVTPINFNYNNPFSAAGWFNFTTLAGDIVLLGHTNTAANYVGWELLNGPSSCFRFFLVGGVGYPTHTILKRNGTALTTLAWYHIGFSYDGSTIAAGANLYRNGALNNGAVDVDNLGANSTTTSILPYIGQRSNGTVPFTGKMADLAVWNVVLTADEFAALANGQRPFAVRPGALAAYWPLDGLQSPEPDLSGVANNGTLTGTAYAPGPPVTMFTPRWPINDVFPYTAPSFIPAWAAQSNLPVIGAGTY